MDISIIVGVSLVVGWIIGATTTHIIYTRSEPKRYFVVEQVLDNVFPIKAFNSEARAESYALRRTRRGPFLYYVVDMEEASA